MQNFNKFTYIQPKIYDNTCKTLITQQNQTLTQTFTLKINKKTYMEYKHNRVTLMGYISIFL